MPDIIISNYFRNTLAPSPLTTITTKGGMGGCVGQHKRHGIFRTLPRIGHLIFQSKFNSPLPVPVASSNMAGWNGENKRIGTMTSCYLLCPLRAVRAVSQIISILVNRMEVN